MSFLFGAATAGLPNNPRTLEPFVAVTGVTPDVTLSFTSFRYAINPAGLRALHDATGALPMITWEPFDPHTPAVDAFPLKRLAAGQFDGYLIEQGELMASLGMPLAVRFAHEMNGAWYPWGLGVHGNTGADYVAAWRHVRDVVTAAGARDVTWVWAPSVLDSASQPDLAQLYPGDSYVDWTGLTTYYARATDTFAAHVQPYVRRLDAVAPSKPIFFAETGVLPGRTRAAQLADLVTGARATPRAIGLTYFNIRGRLDWRIEDEPASGAALRTALGRAASR